MEKTALSIGLAVKEILSSAFGFLKIYPIEAPAGTPSPFIVYSRRGVTVASDKDGIFDDSALVEVVVVCGRYDESIEYAERARRAFSGIKAAREYGGMKLQSAELTAAEEMKSGDMYVQSLTFNIIIE